MEFAGFAGRIDFPVESDVESMDNRRKPFGKAILYTIVGAWIGYLSVGVNHYPPREPHVRRQRIAERAEKQAMQVTIGAIAGAAVGITLSKLRRRSP